MSSIREIHERRESAFITLRDTFQSLKEEHEVYLTEQDLSRYKIKTSQWNLNDDGSKPTFPNGDLKFFQPLAVSALDQLHNPQNLFEPPREDPPSASTLVLMGAGRDTSRNINGFLTTPAATESADESDEPDLLSLNRWNYSAPTVAFKDTICELSLNYPYSWQITRTREIMPKEYPHHLAACIHGLPVTNETEQKLTRGEVLLMINLIMGRMMRGKYKKHEIYPLMMVSYIQTKVRLIHAYYDGQHIRAQVSKLCDMSTYDKGTTDIILRWMLSHPIGNTKVQSKAVPKKY